MNCWNNAIKNSPKWVISQKSNHPVELVLTIFVFFDGCMDPPLIAQLDFINKKGSAWWGRIGGRCVWNIKRQSDFSNVRYVQSLCFQWCKRNANGLHNSSGLQIRVNGCWWWGMDGCEVTRLYRHLMVFAVKERNVKILLFIKWIQNTIVLAIMTILSNP